MNETPSQSSRSRSVAEDAVWEHWLQGLGLVPGKDAEEKSADNKGQDGLPRAPGVHGSRPAKWQREDRSSGSEQGDPTPIQSGQLLSKGVRHRLEVQAEHAQGKADTDQREIKPADPPPRRVLAEGGAKDRAEDGAEGHRDGDEADVEGALVQRRDIGDDDLVEHVEPPAAQGLHDAAYDDDGQGLADGEDDGADAEQGECHVQGQLAAEDVGDARVDGLHDGLDQYEGDAGPECLQSGSVELIAYCLSAMLACPPRKIRASSYRLELVPVWQSPGRWRRLIR